MKGYRYWITDDDKKIIKTNLPGVLGKKYTIDLSDGTDGIRWESSNY
jgi:hypothetical protein